MDCICSYQSTLKLLFQEFATGEDSESQLAVVTTRIMQALQSNLDGKSKQYKDPALTYLFLMNNIHYIVRSVRRYAVSQSTKKKKKCNCDMEEDETNNSIVFLRSEAKDLLGDDWVQRHRRIVQQNANQYKRVAWAKVFV